MAEINSQRTTEAVCDADLWTLYVDNPSTKKLAIITGYNERTIRRRLAAIRTSMGPVANPDIDRAGKLEQLVASIPLHGPGGSHLKEASVKLYGVAAKDELTQQIVTEGLDSTGAVYRFDRQALDVEPHESKIVAYNPTGIVSPKLERIFIIGDLQIGFWATLSPSDPQKITFTPFHDERAFDVQMQALALYRPDRVVIVGDWLDFAQLSRFQQEPQWAQTMQASIQEAYDLLAKIRKTVGNARIDFLPGNHELRIQRAIMNGNPALHNLTRPGEKWPVYSVPSLLRFNDLKIECAAEYPSGEVWLAQRRGNIPGLVVTHADPKRKELRADAIHGHLVLPSLETRQVFYEDGPVTYTRICVSGCGNYSDTSDRVRLTRTNTPSGRARMAMVQSFASVSIDRRTGLRAYGLHLIHDGRVAFHGKIISARGKKCA